MLLWNFDVETWNVPDYRGRPWTSVLPVSQHMLRVSHVIRYQVTLQCPASLQTPLIHRGAVRSSHSLPVARDILEAQSSSDCVSSAAPCVTYLNQPAALAPSSSTLPPCSLTKRRRQTWSSA